MESTSFSPRGRHYKITKFGYRSNWYLCLETEWYPSSDRYYYSVPDNFKLSEIKDFKRDESYFCNTLNMITQEKILRPVEEPPFPVGDYTFVDDLLEIAEATGLDLPMTDDDDEYEPSRVTADLEQIRELAEKVKEKVEQDQRLLTILSAEPIMNLAKKLDQGNLQVINLTNQIETLEKKLKEVSEKFSESEGRVQSQEKKISQLEQENQELKLERVTLKEDLIAKLKKALSE